MTTLGSVHALRDRARSQRSSRGRGLALAACLASIGIVGWSAVRSVRELFAGARTATSDSHLSAGSREATPIYALGAQYPDVKLARDLIPAGAPYLLVLSQEDRSHPYTAGQTRNAVLYLMYPNLAVDDRRRADYLVGVDGAHLVAAGATPGSVTARGSVEVAKAAGR